MEMELKILKEKVVEDEKKSGIGSLFDDDKTSFQHISLLKSKYQQMRRDYDKRITELGKVKIKVIGEQFVLNSQIDVMRGQNNNLKDENEDHNRNYQKEKYDIDKEYHDIYSIRSNLDADKMSM